MADRAIELAKSIEKNKVLRNPYILAKRIFQASLGVIPRYPVPGVSKSLFHPFSGVVFIPEPTKEVFPKLHEALSKIEEAKELFNLDYQRYDSYFGGRFGGGSGLRIGDKDYNDHPFYLADSYVDIERTLGRVSWDKLAEKGEVEKEVVFYSKLMVLAAAFASGDVYNSILDLVDAVKQGKVMFFPGYTNAYEKPVNDQDIEQYFSAIWENAKSQAEEFIREALEIYRRYCNIKLSEALSTKTKKVITGDRVVDTLRSHLGNVKKVLRDNYVVNSLESLYEKISSEYGEKYEKINNLEVYSRIASEILYELDRQFADEYKIYIENARVILNSIDDPDEESKLDPIIQEALEYVRLITGPGALANLISGLGENPESNDVKEILGFVTLHFGPSPEGIYHISLSREEIEKNIKDYLGDPSKVGYVESELSKYVTKKFDPIRKSLGFTTSSDLVYSQKLDPNVPFIPKLGIVAPGNPTLYGGVPLVPSLDYQDDPYAGSLGVVPSFLRSSLLNVYYYDRETKTLYLVGINIPYLIKDMSFTKDSERVVKNKEVFLNHYSKIRVVFANGLKLEIETVSEDPVEPFAVKAAEEAVQSEEFAELMEQAKNDPYATSLLNEVQLLAGKVERLRIFSSSNPKESVDRPSEKGVLVELPSESLEYWIKANNYLLSYEGRIEDTTLQAVREFVRSQKYLERYLSELPLPSVSDTLFGGLDKDMADFGKIDFGDEDVEDTKDLKKTKNATPQKVRGVKGKSTPAGKDYEDLPEEPSYEEEPGTEGTGAEGDDLRGSGKASGASRRNAFTYITLLRRAINLARQSISRSV
jgi:hypothetical protein